MLFLQKSIRQHQRKQTIYVAAAVVAATGSDSVLPKTCSGRPCRILLDEFRCINVVQFRQCDRNGSVCVSVKKW